MALFSRGRPLSEVALRAATDTLDHRGPDGRAVWLSPDRTVGLGNTRLGIVDLRTGHQPIASEDEGLRIVANGEFYDFERLRRALESAGHRFRTRTDTEVALHLYEDYGAHCLPRLRGEFALAIWDSANRTLFAARDRFGAKPLYYAVRQEVLHVASEVKAIFAAGVDTRWDEESLYQRLTGPSLPDRTLFRGVRQLPAGHYLLATPEAFRVVPYWDLAYAATPASEPGVDDDALCAARFRAALDEAVQLRLRADVPVACYLSGGLDSCSVLGIAARHAGRPMEAFTISFADAAYDERHAANEMATLVGASLHTVPVGEQDFADHFPASIRHAETLVENRHGVARYILSRAVRDAGYRAVLTGEGADEVLGGYGHFRRDVLLHGDGGPTGRPGDEEALRELERANHVSRGILFPETALPDLAAARRVLGFTPSWMAVRAAIADRTRSLLSDDTLALYAGWDPVRHFLDHVDVTRQVAGGSPFDVSCYLYAKSMLPNYMFPVLDDRMEMAHSVEGRLPYLDDAVVAVVVGLPPDQRTRVCAEKRILREAARDVITGTAYRRPKHPFLAPPASSQASGPFRAFVEDTLRSSALAAVPLYDPARVCDLLDRLPSMTDDERVLWDPVLMLVLSSCVLNDEFGLGG